MDNWAIPPPQNEYMFKFLGEMFAYTSNLGFEAQDFLVVLKFRVKFL